MIVTSHHPTEHLTHQEYRADIDGLRAVAVLAVIAFHAFPNGIKGGFIGVDIFFVISGYLISTIIISNLEYGSFSFIEFYARRIKRIFPALLLVLTACFVFGWFALLADEYKQLGKHIAGGAGFVANLLYWDESGYFDNSPDTKPLLHLWSLGIEEQFYIAWPFLLWLAWKRKFNLLTSMVGVALISFALNVGTVRVDAIAAFYSPQTRFWELLTGSILAQMTLRRKRFLPRLQHRLDAWLGNITCTPGPEVTGNALRDMQSLLGILLIVIGFLVVNKERQFPGWWAALPVLGAAFIIAAGAQAWFNRVVLSNRVLVWFGLISFPLYLWHWPLLSFARIIEGGTPAREIQLAAVGLAILLASLTYRLVEKPLRFGQQGRTKTIVLLVLMGVAGFVGYHTYRKDGSGVRSHNDLIIKKVGPQLEGALWQHTENDICKVRYPTKYTYFCMQNKVDSPTLILLGNSFANHLYAGIIHNKKLMHHTVLSFGSCDPGGTTGDCAAQNKIIEDTPTIKYAILSNWWPRFDASGQSVQYFSGAALIDSRFEKEQYLYSLDRRISFLEGKGIQVVIFSPKPEIEYDIRNCFNFRPLSRKTPKSCSISIDEATAQQKYILAVLFEVLRRHPQARYFDQNPLFCSENKCSFLQNGMPLLRDRGHYSEFGSEQVIQLFSNWAKENVPSMLR